MRIGVIQRGLFSRTAVDINSGFHDTNPLGPATPIDNQLNATPIFNAKWVGVTAKHVHLQQLLYLSIGVVMNWCSKYNWCSKEELA